VAITPEIERVLADHARLPLAYPAARIRVPSPFGLSNTSMIAAIADRVFSFIAILVKSSGPKVSPRASD
jgi:hypothetical protein